MSEKYGKGYDHLDDAAAAALMRLSVQPRWADQEYMGLLIKGEDGKYYRTNFQTQGSRHSSEWTGYPGGQVAGVVHNHPASRSGNKYPSTHFSPEDINTARSMNVPSYVTTPQHLSIPAQVRHTPDRKTNATQPIAGEEFLAEFPWEEFKQHMMRQILERAPNDPRGLMR
jgi:hypothetical protein